MAVSSGITVPFGQGLAKVIISIHAGQRGGGTHFGEERKLEQFVLHCVHLMRTYKVSSQYRIRSPKDP